MKTLFILLFCLLFGSEIFAQENPKWLRYPSISPDGTLIAFTYKGDIYTVPTEGGLAEQLTFHEAHDYMPVWSKDSKRLAFASDRYGNFDIYLMDASGGAADRLTFHSTDEMPYSFSSDGKHIVFGGQRMDIAEHRQYPTGRMPELYTVPVEGGRIGQVLTIPAEWVQFSNDGRTMIYHDKKGYEDEWRKHHTSSITRDIWVYDIRHDRHKMITDFNGEDRNPVFSPDQKNIFYLSEESGSFNVHKMSLDGGESTQLTDFDLHPVRFLSIGNGTLAFGYDGELYTMVEGQEPQKVPVTVRTQEISNKDKFITINGGVGEMDISPDGKQIAFIARGEVFVTSNDGSFTKRITNTPEQEAFVQFTHDGKGVIYSSERDGNWKVYQSTIVREEEPYFYAATLLNEELILGGETDFYQAQMSPDGNYLAFVEGRRSLRIKNLETEDVTTILTPDELFHMRDGDQYFTWSPDSKWLLVGWRKLLHNTEVLLVSADGSEKMNLTQSGYHDFTPKWANEGKQMLWLSNRHGLKSYATSGRSELDVYSMFFTQEAWDEFNMSEKDLKLKEDIEEANKKEDDTGDEEKEEKKKTEGDSLITIEKEGLEDRKARLTIHSSYLSDAVLSKDAQKLYYLSQFEGGYNLWETDLKSRETKMAIRLNTGSGDLQWDDSMENLYLLSRGRISKLNPSSGTSESIQISGEMEYDEVREREHLFDHVYIRTKNIFYEPTFHGNDWDMLYEEYQKYLPYIGNEYEFAEMLSELLGELNVSHAGGRYSRSIDNPDATASLGIFYDYEHEGEGIRITEIINGGPLDKAKFDIRPGSVIHQIDGVRVSPDIDFAALLNRKAGEFTLLEISGPGIDGRKEITVKPISQGEENRLLYDRFVDINAKEVEEKTKGKLGYVHIPGMSDGPYRNIYEEMLGKYVDTEAVIVDTRFNGGGDLVADLAMFFTGEPFLTYATEDKVVGGEPTSRWTKPTLSLFNESMYSDGHCYASGYTDLDIGTTVGMPVPGTCSFAGWEGLSNGVVWGVVPVSAKNKAGEWLENNQVEPDIKVKNMPGIIDRGRDQQLERAIEVLLKEVE